MKESKEQDDGVGRQKVDKQRTKTEKGVLDEQEKNETERAASWLRGRTFAGGCRAASCGLVRCSGWLCYSLAVACVGWAETSRETNPCKKVAEFTLSPWKHTLQVLNKRIFQVIFFLFVPRLCKSLMRRIKVGLKHFKYFEPHLCLSRSAGGSFLPYPAQPAPGPTVGAPFSSRVYFQLTGPHWVQFQQTENLLTFGEKYAFSNMPHKSFLAS